MTDLTPVEIEEIVDRIIEIRLADGAIVHYRPQVVAAYRVDAEDGPGYQFRSVNQFHVIREPDEKPLNKPIPLKPVS